MTGTESGEFALEVSAEVAKPRKSDIFEVAAMLAQLAHHTLERERLIQELQSYPEMVEVLFETNDGVLESVIKAGNDRRLGGLLYIGGGHRKEIIRIITTDLSN